jgi:alpha-galactosidase
MSDSVAYTTLGQAGHPRARWHLERSRLELDLLFGVACHGTAPASIRTDLAIIEADDLVLLRHAASGQRLDASWQVRDSGLRLDVTWDLDERTGAVLRSDELTNTSARPVTILRAMGRIGLERGAYELFQQVGRWSQENQGFWTPLHGAAIQLGHLPGRTSQGNTPMAAIRDSETGAGFALHLLPRGNWVIRAGTATVGHGMAAAFIEWGQSAEGFRVTLRPGESWRLPEAIIVQLAEGQVEPSGTIVQRLALSRWLHKTRPEAPVVWNTWLDQFDNLDPPRLRRQLAAARQIGCEVLVIDAGWFGKGRGDWFNMTGNWHERPDAAFGGRMSDFADEVRAAGLGFGLWMESEHVGPDAPIRAEHPEWFVGSSQPGKGPRLDLENPQALAWLRNELVRLIETYRLAWIKIDFNIELGKDHRGSELRAYHEAWYALVDELRARFPGTVFEGCSSGGMRLDLEVLRHFDGHFLTDDTHPLDVLRIAQGAALRLPLGRVSTWVTLRSLGRVVPEYPNPVSDARELIAATPAVGWQPVQVAETIDPDLAMLVCMPNMLGFSGDLAGLSEMALQRLAGQVEVFKQWRRFITSAHAHLLTRVRPIEDRSGWAAIQLCNEDDPRSLVFVYRLQDNRGRRLIRLRGLDRRRPYRITSLICPAGNEVAAQADGEALLETGLDARLPRPGTAMLCLVEPA